MRPDSSLVDGIAIAEPDAAMIAGFLRELPYSTRSLARTPALAAALILTIALGIASNATVDGFVRGLLAQDQSFPADAMAGISRLLRSAAVAVFVIACANVAAFLLAPPDNVKKATAMTELPSNDAFRRQTEPVAIKPERRLKVVYTDRQDRYSRFHGMLLSRPVARFMHEQCAFCIPDSRMTNVSKLAGSGPGRAGHAGWPAPTRVRIAC